jgi:hypothetical protein
MSTKHLFVVIASVICFTVSLASASYCSSLRLMAMGDMQGIIDDDSDYLWDVAYLPFVGKSSVSISYLDNAFQADLPNNNITPVFSDIIDLNRNGNRNAYNADIVEKFGPSFAMNLRLNNETRDFSSTYIDETGAEQKLERKGTTTQGVAGLAYDIGDWLALGIGYESYITDDQYTGSEPSREGINCSEQGDSKGLTYSLRFHSPDFFFTLGSGGQETSVLETKDDTEGLIGTRSITGPVNSHLMIGGKLLSGKLELRYGAFLHKTPYGDNGRSLLGMQIMPFKQLVIGLGSCLDMDSCFVDITKSMIGVEYSITNNIKLRCGLENKSVVSYHYADDSLWGGDFPEGSEQDSTDYSCGFEYDLTENLILECAYKDYQDICGGYQTFGAASYYASYWDYWYSSSENRNHLIACSIKWCY